MRHKKEWCACLSISALALATIAATTKAAAQSRYVPVNGGTEVKDIVTNLVWRRCAEGKAWNGSTCDGLEAGYQLDDALRVAASERARTGQPWRIPNIKELGSLVDLSKRSPAIDLEAFPGASWLAVWSSTPYRSTPGCCVFEVRFGDGEITKVPINYVLSVRLVRAAE